VLARDDKGKAAFTRMTGTAPLRRAQHPVIARKAPLALLK
jgi:hypothetical protein